MLKDIFIDNNVAKNFANPLDEEYRKLVKWLIKFDRANSVDNAYIAVSNKLLGEYSRTTGSSHSATNIIIIVAKCTQEGRLNKISNRDIRNFQKKYFKEHIVKKFTCNRNDWDHIPVVLLSDRKYVLSLDGNFRKDVNKFPGFSAKAVRRPQDLSYDK